MSGMPLPTTLLSRSSCTRDSSGEAARAVTEPGPGPGLPFGPASEPGPGLGVVRPRATAAARPEPGLI